MRVRRIAIAGIAALALLAVALLYLLFPSAAYTGDGTHSANLVRHFGQDDSTGFYRLFLHPRHLAYGPLGVAFDRALGPPPPEISNVEILRLVHLSSILGAVALFVFLAALWRATGDIAPAVLGTLLLAFSYAFWVFSVNVGVQPLMLLALALFLLGLVEPPSPRNAAFLGIALGLGILAHTFLFLLVVPALLHLGSLAREDRVRRLRALGLFAASGILVAGIPYFLALPWTSGGSFQGALSWLALRPSPEPVEGIRDGFARGLAGLEKVFVGDPHPVAGRATTFRWALRFLFPGLILSAVLLGRGERATDAGRRLARGCLWTLATFLPLWLFWDAGNPAFLVLAGPPVFALVAVAVGRIGRAQRRRRRALALLLLTVGVGLIGSYHFASVIYPESDPWNNEAWVWTRFIVDRTDPGDLVLISGVGDYRIGKSYLGYFGPRRRTILQWKLIELGDPMMVAADVRGILAEEAARGRAVYMTSEIFFPSTIATLRDGYGFDRTAMRALFDGWRREPIAALGPFTLFALLPDDREDAQEPPAEGEEASSPPGPRSASGRVREMPQNRD